MKKIAVLLLVLLTMATMAGTASAKARGMIVFDANAECAPEPAPVVFERQCSPGYGVPAWGMPTPSESYHP